MYIPHVGCCPVHGTKTDARPGSTDRMEPRGVIASCIRQSGHKTHESTDRLAAAKSMHIAQYTISRRQPCKCVWVTMQLHAGLHTSIRCPILCSCQMDAGMDDVRVLFARLRYCSLDNSPIESGIGPSRSFPAGDFTR